MKKLLALAFAIASIGFVTSSADAATSTNFTATTAASPQRDDDRWDRQNRRGRWYNDRARVTTQTRIVHQGRRVFRETYQVRYFPNGRVQTSLISRVRIR